MVPRDVSMVVEISPLNFSLLPASADVSTIVFCQISFQSLNVLICCSGPYDYYIGFDLFQFHPSIEIDYILKFQFDPHAFNFVD